MRHFLLLLLFIPTGCFADDDPAVLETAKRMHWNVELVQQHHLTGCESGRPMEMAVCGAYQSVKADLTLNSVYSRLLSELKTKDAKAKLMVAQRAWIAYRDSACSFENNGYKDSRELSAVSFGCEASYAEERIKHLESYLGCNGEYGCPGVE